MYEIQLLVRKMINIPDGQSPSNFVLLQLQFSLHIKARRMFGNGKVLASVLIKHVPESCQIFITADRPCWLVFTTWLFTDTTLSLTHTQTHNIFIHAWALLPFVKFFSDFPCLSLTGCNYIRWLFPQRTPLISLHVLN